MVRSVFIGSLRHDTFDFGWSPGSHQSEENPFLAAVAFLDNVKGERKMWQKDESQPGCILTDVSRWWRGWGEENHLVFKGQAFLLGQRINASHSRILSEECSTWENTSFS